jgi:phosphatidylserine/phosphatidylglycerophosphate/cardiolipin synthase-like enzyme
VPVSRSATVSAGLTSLDAVVGDAIERAVTLKHRRRLRRNGWLHAVESGPGTWSQSDPPPREGCQLEVLVDGAEAFKSMAEAIRGAHESIYVAGWFITPSFELVRGMRAQSIGALLARAAERVDVRVLVWAGSPVPAFQPSRAQVTQAVSELTRATQIVCATDRHEHLLHCHHEKTLVIDGVTAFVGGIDMTDLKNDRYDTSGHPARRRTGWHDVATRLTGPVVADAGAHFAMRWGEVTGEQLELKAPPAPTGEHTVQLVRTIPEGMYSAMPKGDFSVLESYVRAIRGARRIIYLENQFLWSPEITDLLADKLQNPPTQDFRTVIVLPTRAHAGQDDTLGQVGLLQAADRHDRLVVATLRSLSGERDDQLYIHAKAAVIDDAWLTVGSANLNAHSLFNDTEVNVVSDTPALARDTRLRLWAEHLDVDRAEIELRSPAEVVDELWRPITQEQLRRQQADQLPTHRLLAVSVSSRRSRRLLGPLNGLIDDG